LLHRLDKALPRVGDLPSACFELLFEIGAGLASSPNARLRSGQMKPTTSRSALRPFARQGHLHRRTNPECWPVTAGDGACGENSTQPTARVSTLTANLGQKQRVRDSDDSRDGLPR